MIGGRIKFVLISQKGEILLFTLNDQDGYFAFQQRGLDPLWQGLLNNTSLCKVVSNLTFHVSRFSVHLSKCRKHLNC